VLVISLTALGIVLSEWGVRWLITRQHSVVGRGRIRAVSDILSQYGVADIEAENRLADVWNSAQTSAELEGYEKLWWTRLQELMRLRAFVFGNQARGALRLRQGFGFRVESEKRQPFPAWENDRRILDEDHLTFSEIASAGTEVAALYWHLYLSCNGEFPELKPMARKLYAEIFDEPFRESTSRARIESLIDRMQGPTGVNFLMLNLLKRQDYSQARALGRFLIGQKDDGNEDQVTTLYWLGELTWFLREDGISTRPLDYSDVIRNLYHLCFVAPERAGFLEIDSQFFSEFATINEMAREGFLFVDGLFEQIVGVWKQNENYFDPIFRTILERLSGVKSKVHQDVAAWERVLHRATDGFCQEYLFIVEGNLCYALGEYEDAVACFQRALALNPEVRSARMNLLFCYAQMHDRTRHDALARQVVADPKLHPSAWYVVGNSFLLAGDVKMAESYYDALKKIPGWEAKVDHYKSTFCFEHAMWHEALHFARLAHQKNPHDSSIRYHLSLCFDRLGKKQNALDALRGLGEDLFSDWLSFYRFTLERDSGMDENAAQTLKQISSQYFKQETDDWQQALEYAKASKDLELLRHLKKVQ
jgi:tetratricopeptide (TPR) repeat protein